MNNNDIKKIKISLKNRTKVLAILKNTIINDEIRINKLMLAYDLNIIKVLSDDDNQTIETKRNAFCKQFSKTYGMNIDICEQIFDDWCDLLDVENFDKKSKNESDCRNIVSSELCYLSHFYKCYGDADICDEIIDTYEPWFYAFCNDQIELINLNKDYNSMIDTTSCEILANIKKIVFESRCDVDKKQGKLIIDDKNKNCKLKMLCVNNELKFYTDANKFVIPDSIFVRLNERAYTYKAFFSCMIGLKEIVGLHNICTTSNKNFTYLFENCHSLETIDVSNWDTSKVTDMGFVFEGCTSLETIDISNWDTNNVTDMRGMFSKCTSLKTIDVSKWDTSKVTDMGFVFDGCTNLKAIDVSNWDTSNVIDMNNMFSGCNNLETIDVSNWDTSKVTYMSHMFGGCNNLKTIDVSNWDTNNVTDMRGMFFECTSLKELETIDVSKWDVNLVREISPIRFLNVKKYCYYDDENKSYKFQWAFKQFKNSFHFPYKCDLLVKIINNANEIVYEGKYVITKSDYGNWVYNDGHSELLGTIYIGRDKIKLGNSKVGKIEYKFTDDEDNYWFGTDCEVENLPLKEILISLQNKFPILVSDKINKEYKKSDDKNAFIFNDWKGQIEKINFKYIDSNRIEYEIVFKLLKLINPSSKIFINYKIKRKKDMMILADGSIVFSSMEEKDKKLVKGSIYGEDFNLNDKYIFCID